MCGTRGCVGSGGGRRVIEVAISYSFLLVNRDEEGRRLLCCHPYQPWVL